MVYVGIGQEHRPWLLPCLYLPYSACSQAWVTLPIAAAAPPVCTKYSEQIRENGSQTVEHSTEQSNGGGRLDHSHPPGSNWR